MADTFSLITNAGCAPLKQDAENVQERKRAYATHLSRLRAKHQTLLFLLVITGCVCVSCPASIKGQSSAASLVVRRYVSAVQSGDRKTIVNLSYEAQQQISSIKTNNPQALWAKVLKEYYDAQSAAPLDQWADMVALFIPQGAEWRITEARVNHDNERNTVKVYASVSYHSLADSPLVGTAYLKSAILQFDVSSAPLLIVNVVRLTEGDSQWGHIPLMILNARWFAEGLSGSHMHLFAIGGKTPYHWSVQCGSLDLAQDFSGVDGFGIPLNQSNQELIIDSGGHLANLQYPLPCTASIKDADGNTDTVAFSVPKLLTGLVNNYCWARAPWSHRGQGLPYLPIGSCIGKVADFELSKNNQ